MQTYDFIIAGGGGAGLSLAYALVNSPLAGASILIVEKDQKVQNDRTWCFWADQPTLFDSIAYKVWDHVQFVGEGFEKIIDLAPYQYRMIRGIDFYKFTQRKLAETATVTFLHGNIDAIQDGDDHAVVQVDGMLYQGKWVFDSAFRAADLVLDPQRYHYLKQHFLGWEIETLSDAFDLQYATLFDFRTPQKGDMRFMYVLPFSPRRALVEYTIFSATLLPQNEYEEALHHYIEEVLGISDFRILEKEQNWIPMTDQPFDRRLGKRILAIGTKGGRVKPSTGYAFLRIQRDTAAIVDSLVRQGHPFYMKHAYSRYLFYDSIMLQLMYRNGNLLKTIFTRLFARNPIRRIFRFLDEVASFVEDVQLMASLPVILFLRAMLRIKLLHKL